MRILVPTDFSTASLKAIPMAKNLAEKLGGKILLLFVEEPVFEEFLPEKVQQILEGYSKELHRYAEERLEEIWEKNVKKQGEKWMIRSGKVAQVIAEVAQEEQVDFICMATQGMSREKPAGSVTEKVIRLSSVPVLVVPPEEEEE